MEVLFQLVQGLVGIRWAAEPLLAQDQKESSVRTLVQEMQLVRINEIRLGMCHAVEVILVRIEVGMLEVLVVSDSKHARAVLTIQLEIIVVTGLMRAGEQIR